MNNQKSRSLDDVLDYYLISSEKRGADTLPEMIELYPQYERDLRELSAFRRLQESLPGRTYTDEEETALKDRGVSIVQAIFREKQSRTQRGPSMLNPDNATLEWCAKWIEDSLRAETNERTIEFGRNMAMTIRAVHAAPPDEADKALAKKGDARIQMLVLSIAANQFIVPLPTGKEVVEAVNNHARLLAENESLRAELADSLLKQEKN